jgi:hypothetical protein
MTEDRRKWHFNIGGPRGWTAACGIESSSFVSKWDEVDCQRCLNSEHAKAARLLKGLTEAQRSDLSRCEGDRWWSADGRVTRAMERKGLIERSSGSFSDFTPLGIKVRDALRERNS